jgi:hypothetical protein
MYEQSISKKAILVVEVDDNTTEKIAEKLQDGKFQHLKWHKDEDIADKPGAKIIHKDGLLTAPFVCMLPISYQETPASPDKINVEGYYNNVGEFQKFEESITVTYGHMGKISETPVSESKCTTQSPDSDNTATFPKPSFLN